MAFTKRNRAAVKALVSAHETGKPVANYSAIVVLKDDAGITFGAHQATHKSGTIYKIVKMYCDISNSSLSKQLDSYVSGFKNPALRHKYSADKTLKNLLVKAGEEPAMRFAQDKVFEVNYLEPSVQAVTGSGWKTPLALAVVYDSMIQGGWTKVRDRVKGDDEKTWIKNYVAARRKWLSSSSRQVVRNSVYRMTTFEKLIASNNWDLDTPFTVHGVKVNDDHLAKWIAAESAIQEIEESGESETITIEEPAPNFFIGNTEGIADDGLDDVVDDSVMIEEPVISPEPEVIDNQPVGVPVETIPVAIVGGRPQDPPIIVEQTEDEKAQGWRTWPTTILATCSGAGLTVGGLFTQISGMTLSPELQGMIGWIILAGIVVAGGFGIFYLVSRKQFANAEKQRNHEIMLKEMELRSMPDRYNVKLDRRGDISNISTSGLPFVDKR